MRPRYVVGRVCMESGAVTYRRGTRWVPQVGQATHYRSRERAERVYAAQVSQVSTWDYYFDVLRQVTPLSPSARSRASHVLEQKLALVLAEGEELERERGQIPSGSFDAWVNELAGREEEIRYALERLDQ